MSVTENEAIKIIGMDEIQEQMLVNQLTIMEALITVFHASNSDRYDCACRNLELRAEDTYRLLKEKRDAST